MSACLLAFALVAGVHLGAGLVVGEFEAAAALFEAGHLLLAGALASLCVGLWQRLLPESRARSWLARADVLLLGVAAALVGVFVLADDVSVRAGRMPGTWKPAVWRGVLSVAIAQCVPLALLGARLFRRLGWPRMAAVPALAGAVGHLFVLPRLYPGVHLVVVCSAAVALASALAPAASLGPASGPPGRASAPPASPARRRFFAALWGVAAACGLASVAIAPGPEASTALVRSTSAVFAPWVLRLHDETVADAPRLSASEQPWYRDRSAEPPRPPAGPPFAAPGGHAPLVVLITIDCLRADLVHDPAREAELPVFAALRRASIDFLEARTPAPSTAPALVSIFSGLYYSQVLWRPKSDGKVTRLWPAEDESTRFPALLTAAGVSTLFLASEPDLLAELGVTRGFAETRHPAPGFAPEMVDAALAWLGARSAGPAFLAMHLIDAHWPYDRGGVEGTPFERHLAELRLVDAELGRLLAGLSNLGLAEHTLLLVSADHGENFGEHGGQYHGGDLHENVLRVPLFVRGPGLRPRAEPTPVGLVDLGPTLLDVFGLPTPAVFQGESLWPLLNGAPAHFTRPRVVDSGRRMQAMYFDDGLKILRDLRIKRVDLYDLQRDPGESRNRYDRRLGDHRRRLARLGAFFEAHALQLPGYEIPFRQ